MSAFRSPYAEYYDAGRQYEFITEMAPGVWKVFRKADRMEFLAQDVTDTLFSNSQNAQKELTTYGQLLRPGLGGINILKLITDILNHDNLVSMVDCFVMDFTSNAGSANNERWFTLWDFCDAGNLGNLLVLPQKSSDKDADNDTQMKDILSFFAGAKFLPETFCWHVLVSVLRALAWLHDGVKNVGRDNNGMIVRQYEDPDWQPVLHRNITPQNIFLGHKKRREWYGPVKLGNYGRLVVSGHCQTPGDTAAPTFSKVIAPPSSQTYAPLEDLVAWDATHGSVYPQQADQPYTMVSEYRALGEILQAMMVEPTTATHLRTIRSQQARTTLLYLGYTARLRNLVVKLMEMDPWQVTGQAGQANPTYVTTDLLLEAVEGLNWFISTGSDEASGFITPSMAIAEDYQEKVALQNSQGVESAQNLRDILATFQGSA
ncbi:hypothetical protein F5Y16DRAFT_405884 [Xylariaceae sp. FL0255]|nr:hypothetical protein F5Y16DRAFT_405884 [Xylariaceae sp. FL0255]